MNLLADLPAAVVDLLLGNVNADFATVTKSGLPIDTPMLVFPSDGMKSFDVCTGLAYPAKAERARNNPKVGLLFEGAPHEPVVYIAGLAAVRDSDIQANTTRYIHETAWSRPLNPPWSLARKAVYYWARMLIAITPVRILWWDRPDAMDRPPTSWHAPANAIYPKSDPKPPGATSPAPKWSDTPWHKLAEDVLKLNMPGHLTLCDSEGYPVPIRARSVTLTDQGFRIEVPAGAPWQASGKATLTFFGRETFVGEARQDNGAIQVTVERALPINPFMGDPNELWRPTPPIYDAMMGRLRQELARRNQSLPTLPEAEPEPTEYSKRRRAKFGADRETAPFLQD